MFLVKLFLFVAGLSSLPSVLARPGNFRRDDVPKFPYDSNTTPYCTWWVDNDGSTACQDIPAFWAISFDDFRRWNPSITASCGGFEVGKSYCVEAYGEPAPTTTTNAITTTTPTPTTTSITSATVTVTTITTDSTPTETSIGNDIATPTPTQPGMVSNCNKFYKVTDDDGCESIALANGITLSDFYIWNTQVGTDCSSLWTDYYVCIAVIGTTTTVTTAPITTTPTSTNGISTPTPIQPGMISNCDAFYYVESDDVTCAQIAHDNDISLSQFYTWNPTVGTDCSSLWTDYYVCISVIGVSPTTTSTMTTTTTTTSTGNGVATPTPIEPGMTTSCKTFHKVVAGDECGVIATNAGITLANFIKWNPQVGSDCSDLWLDYYVCTGVL
ncbi:uncharacterized protein N7496_009733 [Penicillium cataractarum]|uniref:LysM domain-containing protein n=1 Tax=Penicillium cataractarum TaxID=2100454 RepID=A0A9W9RQX5_9EURO|nr:uncharacterized protein N7496_009733 [Penicillium cataractarum]KAJ5364020.1 hypothetical protein N7496_009733 [Penicillium cataractarum]